VICVKILITGSSSGIGFLTGCVLVSRGHNVFFTCRTLEEVNVIKKKLQYLDLTASVFKLNICEESDRKVIMSLELDVLFLHAGVGYTGLLKDMNIDLVRDNYEVNVFSNLEMIQLFLKSSSKPKRVVLTSSLFSSHACPFFGSYIMSKTSVDLMSKILKNELIFSRDKINLIKPGAYHTGFNQYLTLTGEKSNIPDYLISLFNKIFLLVEEKKLNSIVYKIVMAIEKGNHFKYSAPFVQKFLLDY